MNFFYIMPVFVLKLYYSISKKIQSVSRLLKFVFNIKFPVQGERNIEKVSTMINCVQIND